MSCTHKNFPETTLRCGKCEKLICPDCMVETPVGARCRECARLYKLPTFRVNARHYLIASLVGLGMAVVTGIIWAFVERVFRFPYLSFILSGLTGVAIGEVIGLSVNRKRGIGLAIIAGFSMLLSYLTAILVPWGFYPGLIDILVVAIGVYFAVSRLR